MRRIQITIINTIYPSTPKDELRESKIPQKSQCFLTQNQYKARSGQRSPQSSASSQSTKNSGKRKSRPVSPKSRKATSPHKPSEQSSQSSKSATPAQRSSDHPVGLDSLKDLLPIILKQKVKMKSDKRSVFTILTYNGRALMTATENEKLGGAPCCKKTYEMNVTNVKGTVLMNLVEKGGKETLFICAPPGKPIGRIVKHEVDSKLNVMDSSKKFVYEIGLSIKESLAEASEFKIFDSDGKTQVGRIIVRRWTGDSQVASTDADNFEIIFPGKASIVNKTLILAATLYIDLLFFDDDRAEKKILKKM